MSGASIRRIGAVVPVLILAALAVSGIAGAFQADDEEAVDLGPQIADYTNADGESDVAGYLIADAAFNAAPPVLLGETLEVRVFGCTEGAPVLVELIPRVLNEAEAAAQADLADDEKLLEDFEIVIDEAEALADGSSYEVTVPETTPLGFTRLRVTCEGAEGELVTDTVLNVITEADVDDETEPVTAVDAGDTPTALVVPPAG